MPGARYLRKRQRVESQFTRVILWLGPGLVILFLVWAALMVVLQALDQWKSQ